MRVKATQRFFFLFFFFSPFFLKPKLLSNQSQLVLNGAHSHFFPPKHDVPEVGGVSRGVTRSKVELGGFGGAGRSGGEEVGT